MMEKRFYRLQPCERQKDFQWRRSIVGSRTDHWLPVQPWANQKPQNEGFRTDNIFSFVILRVKFLVLFQKIFLQ